MSKCATCGNLFCERHNYNYDDDDDYLPIDDYDDSISQDDDTVIIYHDNIEEDDGDNIEDNKMIIYSNLESYRIVTRSKVKKNKDNK